MNTELTQARGIRLSAQLWEAIDREAKQLGMSRNEYLARRLATFFAAADNVSKDHTSVRDDEYVRFAE